MRLSQGLVMLVFTKPDHQCSLPSAYAHMPMEHEADTAEHLLLRVALLTLENIPDSTMK